MQAHESKLNPNAAKGLQLFNQQAFYDAHEYFETAWRETPAPQREFYRALLQISGGYYRLTQGNAPAARKFFSHALGWLADFPDLTFGIDAAALRSHLTRLIDALDRGPTCQTTIQSLFQPIFPGSAHEDPAHRL
jgi:predicted metal-dependent hydrolase